MLWPYSRRFLEVRGKAGNIYFVQFYLNKVNELYLMRFHGRADRQFTSGGMGGRDDRQLRACVYLDRSAAFHW